MSTWEPIKPAELSALVAEQLKRCSGEDAALFSRISIEPTTVPLQRGEVLESVLAVARIGPSLLVYDDVEHGFEVAAPDPDGVLRSIGAGQFELSHALARIREGLR